MDFIRKHARRFVLGLLAGTIWLSALPALAQQPSPDPQPAGLPSRTVDATPDPPPISSPDVLPLQPRKDPPVPSGTSRDRLFWTMPNFMTVTGTEIPPLTAAQKLKVVGRSAFDPFEYFWYGLISGIGQAENTDRAYGQGLEGYGKRYATDFADGTIENFMVGAVLPSVLHQDPRYHEMGHGGFLRRSGYALSRLFITRSDSGHPEFNTSEVVGGGLAASFSTFTYHPENEHNIGNAASVWGTQIGYDGITLMLKEFWPDIRRRLHRQKD
jgi:hypothetical protein